MTSEALHEPEERLSEATRDLHRAIASLLEEWQAVDWYEQRVQATTDPTLAAILAHNRDEEVEHAAMVLEWIRRAMPVVDRELRKHLFIEDPATHIESAAAESGSGAANVRDNAAGSLGIGALED